MTFQVTNTGKEVLCELCVANPNPKGKNQSTTASKQIQLDSRNVCSSPTRATAQQHNQNGTSGRSTATDGVYDPNACAGCGEQLKEGQALIALDRQWHISCFRFVEINCFLDRVYHVICVSFHFIFQL